MSYGVITRRDYLYLKLQEGSLELELYEQIKQGLPVTSAGNKDRQNALTRLRRRGFISNTGTRVQPVWIVHELTERQQELIREYEAEQERLAQLPQRVIRKRTEKKLIDNVKVGEKIKIAGHICIVRKVEFVHYYSTNSNVRLELHVGENRRLRDTSVLFMPRGTLVTIILKEN
jgi:hypothetical protein